MKKILILGMAVLAVGLAAGQVVALDGPHNTLVGVTAGQCATCHIPHSAGGDRLWVETPTGPAGNWGQNKIGQLCYSCHDGTSFGGSNMAGFAYSATSHQPFYTNIPALPDGVDAVTSTSGVATLNGSGFPYTAATNPLLQGGAQVIQCTSCHTVHTYTGVGEGRPYLRAAAASRGDNCEACHLRGETTGNASKGAANNFAYTLNDISLHPVDISATVQSEGATLVATSALMTRVIGDIATPAYNLGGKLAGGDSGNMECGTCHAVHGDETTPSAGIGNFLLAIGNYTAGYTTSPLCYGCHGLPVVVGMSDHPIDSNGGTYAVTYPSNGGPYGMATTEWAYGAGDEVVCSSCHDMHGGLAADAADLTQGNTLVGRLRRKGGNADDWCYSCHVNASPNNHHSHTGNLDVAQAGDPMTSILTCGDCHGGGGGATAHNAAGGFFATRDFGSGNHASNAYWCNYCHGVNPTDINNPVDLAIATVIGGGEGYLSLHETAGGVDVTPAASGIDRGEGTHILGNDGTMVNTAVKADAWANAFNPFAPGSIDGVADNLSRYPAANEMVCESCHNIIGNIGYTGGTTEADGDAGWLNNLLLEDYEDDGSGNEGGAGAGAVGMTLCVACHAGGVIPAGTHQTTGMTITAAEDNVRATTTLITGAGSYANDGAAPGQASYPDTDAMDCDSCHRPHDGDNDSTVNATVATYAAGTTAQGDDYILEVCGAAFEYSSTLCTECHAY